MKYLSHAVEHFLLLWSSWHSKTHSFPGFCLCPLFQDCFIHRLLRQLQSRWFLLTNFIFLHPLYNYKEIKCPDSRFSWDYAHNRCLFPNLKNLCLVQFYLRLVSIYQLPFAQDTRSPVNLNFSSFLYHNSLFTDSI